MVADLEAAGALCLVDPAEAAMLAGPRRPIVLTSGNVSGEPIAYLDEEALARLRGIAGWFLIHDRPIHMRADDSVVRAFRGRELPLRRSRGFVPQPAGAALAVPRPVLACGAELKHTFCLAKGDRAFLSHHVGDLENHETFCSFTEGVGHFRRLFAVDPEVVAHDLHPEYLSTRYALELDGVGFGADGTIWGGELLVADLEGFRRAGHLEPVPMPGGAAAIREPFAGSRWSPWVARARPPRRPQAPGGCSTRWPRSSASATRSTTRARPRWSWSSWPTPPSGPPTRPSAPGPRPRPGRPRPRPAG
jgi:hydrogenase maturation protein HypF